MLDTLGTLIGFVTVVLLLSLVSTSLVQMTSSMLRLRGRNLFRGLDRVLQAAGKACGVKEDEMNSKELAEKVCSSPGLLEIGRSVLSDRVPRWLRGPSRTRGQRDTLPVGLKEMQQNVHSANVRWLSAKLELSDNLVQLMRACSR